MIDTNASIATGRFFNVEEYDRVGLISLDQRNYFNAGLSMYYQHVLFLFEKAKAHSFVADFARLALQSLDPSDDEVCSLTRVQSL